jgi:hypothetical protein
MGALSLFLGQMAKKTLSETTGKSTGRDGVKPFLPCALHCTLEKRAPRFRTFNMASVLHVAASCMKMLLRFIISTIAPTITR